MRAPTILIASLLLGCSSSGFDIADSPADAVAEDVDSTAPATDTGTGSDDSAAPVDSEVVDSASPPMDAGPGCDPAEKADMAAVFVSPSSGSDSAGDGSSTTPYKTIAKAVLAAKAKLAPKLVLDQGTYTEPVVLTDTDFALAIEGGWKRVGTAWSRQCGAGVRDLTLIQSPAAVGVAANNTKKRTGLAHLTVLTRATGEPGQSLIGVLVRGQSVFFLDDVVVRSGAAGAGLMAETTPPTPAPSCDGIAGCTAVGLTGGPGSSGALALKGTFVADGYVPGNGGPGKPGADGSHGAPGAAGSSSAPNECNWGCSGSSGCDATLLTTVVGKPGKCGCGGLGGKPGAGGRGGGASVAVQVFGPSAAIDIKRSALTAADGGAGSSGALGAMPSAPTKGAAGDAVTCNYGGCKGDVMACYYVESKLIAGGAAGGDGRPAGAGGHGGGGSGGPSHAIVTVGSALSLDASTVLTHGKAGAGAGGAPSGTASPKLAM